MLTTKAIYVIMNIVKIDNKKEVKSYGKQRVRISTENGKRSMGKNYVKHLKSMKRMTKEF